MIKVNNIKKSEWLMIRGHRLKKVVDNKFYFAETRELRADIENMNDGKIQKEDFWKV